VLPAYRHRGIGTALAHWLADSARGLGHPPSGGVTPEGSDGDRLLEKLGYHVRWTSWVLQLPEGATVPARELPPGYEIRAATPDDYEAVWTVVEDAFLEWSVRERDTLEDFLAVTVRRPGQEPWMLLVVTDPSGTVVGTACLVMAGDPVAEGYIERLAVRRDQRGQGPAQALLVDAFELGRQHGAPRSGLSTDSRTGALSLTPIRLRR
jgi:GNAT superfamily N-acetyltransferase